MKLDLSKRKETKLIISFLNFIALTLVCNSRMYTDKLSEKRKKQGKMIYRETQRKSLIDIYDRIFGVCV